MNLLLRKTGASPTLFFFFPFLAAFPTLVLLLIVVVAAAAVAAVVVVGIFEFECVFECVLGLILILMSVLVLFELPKALLESIDDILNGIELVNTLLLVVLLLSLSIILSALWFWLQFPWFAGLKVTSLLGSYIKCDVRMGMDGMEYNEASGARD
jgi:hypothetical protein